MSNELTIEEILMLGNKTMANLILSQHAEINARKAEINELTEENSRLKDDKKEYIQIIINKEKRYKDLTAKLDKVEENNHSLMLWITNTINKDPEKYIEINELTPNFFKISKEGVILPTTELKGEENENTKSKD